MIQTREQTDEAIELQLRLRSQLKKETGLTDEELDALDPLLAEAISLNGGDTEPVRKMVRKSVQMDCVDDCLMERLRTQNRLMLQEHQEELEGGQVASQERVTTRTRTRDGDQSGDQTRTQTQTQSRSQDGSGEGNGGSGGGGGGKNK
jgi:uncharacterized membrane protein YgcG